VIGNDAKVFAGAPGYQSANFHRGHNGTHVINYSHWDSEQAFLDAINALFKLPNLTMEQANQMATAQAGGVGTTDFRFYTVVFSAHA
jgi:heme-degrading monooxygenase HmoA